MQAARRCRGALRGGAPHRARERERESERERDGAAVKRRSDQYDRAAFVEVSAETWASQTRQFLASRTRRELLGSACSACVRARGCARFWDPAHPPCMCVVCWGPARARRVCSTLHPYIILPFSSSTRATRARPSRPRFPNHALLPTVWHQRTDVSSTKHWLASTAIPTTASSMHLWHQHKDQPSSMILPPLPRSRTSWSNGNQRVMEELELSKTTSANAKA